MVSTLHSEISQYAGVSPSSVKILVTETNSTDRHGHPAGRPVRRGHVHDLAGERRQPTSTGGTSTTAPRRPARSTARPTTATRASSPTARASAETPSPPSTRRSRRTTASRCCPSSARTGDEMVTSTSSNALVRVHAVRRADGGLNVLIDNEDPSNSYTVSLSYSGFTPSGSPTVYTLANNAHSDHLRDAELDVVGDGRAVLADRGPASRLRRDRRHRARRARPAARLRTSRRAPPATPRAPRH